MSTTPQNSSRAHYRNEWLALAAIVAATAFTTICALKAPLAAGTWEDDGVYLTTSKALAAGQGYRHPQLPGAPWQTKYPVLYPLVLAAIWRAWPNFPANLVAMQILNGALGGAAAYIGYRLARRAWNLSAILAGTGAVLVAVSPAWMEMTRFTMSEQLFTFLMMAALQLLVVDAMREPLDARRSPLRRPAYAGVFAVAAYLTRSIGICVMVAVILHCALRRRWRPTLRALAICAAAMGATMWWHHLATLRNASIPQAAALGYDLSYGTWLSRGIGSLGWVIYQNTAALGYGVFDIITQTPRAWVEHSLQRGAWASAWLYSTVVVVAGLCVFGFSRMQRGIRRALITYVALYVAVVLVWPFNPWRFLIPLLPLLVPAFMVGVFHVAANLLPGQNAGIRSRSDSIQAPSPITQVRGAPARNAVLILMAALLLHEITLDVATANSSQDSTRQRERAAAVELLRQRTPNDAVIASPAAGYFHLVTSRTVVPFAPSENPVESDYPADRQFRFLGLGTTPGQLQAYERRLEQTYLDYCRTVGVTHVLLVGEHGLADVFRRFAGRHAANLVPSAESGRYRLYEFHASP